MGNLGRVTHPRKKTMKISPQNVDPFTLKLEKRVDFFHACFFFFMQLQILSGRHATKLDDRFFPSFTLLDSRTSEKKKKTTRIVWIFLEK